MSEIELWKDYNETYEVSNMGQVRNKRRNSILSSVSNSQGYTVRYMTNRSLPVHQLVY